MKKNFHNILCLMLAAATLLPTAHAYAISENQSDLSVYVASDIHYRPFESLGPIENQNNLPGDSIYAHCNTKGMLSYEAGAIIDEFLARFEASDAKYLLIPGDTSEDGFWDEHLAIAQKLREFQNRTGKKIFLIPGNHDIRTSDSRNRLNLSDFLEVYADIGFDETLTHHEGSASYTAELDAGYRLLAVDACIYREDGARISDDLMAWIEEQVAMANADGVKLVCMIHHSLLEHFALEPVGGNQLCVENYMDVATRFADWGIKYVFTGHEHANDISTAVTNNGNRIFDIETGSLITYPCAYRRVDFSDTGVEIKTEYIDGIDTSLLPAGYSAEQLTLIENDFVSYSFGCLRAGLRSFAYDVNELTPKVAELLKIEAGTKEYEAVGEAMTVLGEALRLPMYDTGGTEQIDSIEEIVKAADLKLEPNSYKDVIDVAAVIYAGHYAGDENLSMDSLEMKLLGQGLNAALVYTMMNVPARTANIVLSGLDLSAQGFSTSDYIYTTTAKLVYAKSASKAIIKAYFEPIAGGLINDVSAPDDLNVSLEPYGETRNLSGDTVAITQYAKIFDILMKLLLAALKSVDLMTDMA